MATLIGGVLIFLGVIAFIAGVAGFIKPTLLKDPKTGVVPKRLHLFLMTWFVPTLFIAIGGSIVPTSEPTAQDKASSATDATAAPSVAAAPAQATNAPVEKRGLAISPEQFRQRYNTQISEVNKNWRLAELDVSPGEKADVFRRDLDGIYILGGVSKGTGLVRDITIGLGGGGTAQSVRGLAVMLSAAKAVTDGAEKSEVSSAAMKVLKQAMNSVDDPAAGLATAIVGNRQLSALASKEMGLMFVISARD